MTNKMQLCRKIYCSLTALHVSSYVFAHHQEHLNCNYSFWFYSRVSLSAAVSSLQRHTWMTALHVSSYVFAHHQEHLNCNYSFWFYSRVSLSAAVSSLQRHTWIKPEAVIIVKMLLIMSENITRNMWSNQGTINYPTKLHLIGYFCKNKIVIWAVIRS